MRCTIHTTLKCNLRCKYCHIVKSDTVMPLQLAKDTVNFIFKHTPLKEKLGISFSGGEPLLEFELLREIVSLIKGHPSFHDRDINLSITTNGTVFSQKIAEFLHENSIELCISCDGPPSVHDVMRCFPDGKGSSSVVERTLKEAANIFPEMSVQSVYHPATFRELPFVIEYFTFLGIRNIQINPDYSAMWSKKEADSLPAVYKKIADWYLYYSGKNHPAHISLIDKKMAIIEQGGYMTSDKCSPGKSGLAFAPSGNIYACERFITEGSGKENCIGNIYDGILPEAMTYRKNSGIRLQNNCIFCDIKDFCMNWCCCSNYLTSGFYDKPGPFLCASEKTAIKTVFNIYQTIKGNSVPAIFKSF